MYLISKEAVTQRCLDSTSGLIKEKSKCLELNDPLLAKNPQNIHTGQTKINSPIKRKKKKGFSGIDCQSI